MGHNTITHHLIQVLRQSFCRTAIPEKWWSDRGLQFTAKAFNDFENRWGFSHMTSTPQYPQSNGEAEAMVKSMKKIINMCWNRRALDNNQLCRAVLQYANTPSRKDGLTPAQKLYGRPVQDTLPAYRRSFSSEWQRAMEDTEQKAESVLEKSAEFYNLHSRSLPEIRAGVAVNPVSPI